jgi:heterotetrameric sarcosine oxidase gamma subunit
MSNTHSGNVLPTPLQQVGMEGTPFHGDTLELKEVTGATILRLHSLAPAGQLAAELESHGVELPLQPNNSTGSDPAALCLRSNEWLLFSEQSDPERLFDRLRPAVDPAQTSLLNNSDGLATFRLSGRGAPWLLSKLSGLDYLAGSSGGGSSQGQHCTRTRMAHAAVVVHYHQPGGGDSKFVFDLLFDRSLAKYLWELLRASTAHADDLAKTFGRVD